MGGKIKVETKVVTPPQTGVTTTDSTKQSGKETTTTVPMVEETTEGNNEKDYKAIMGWKSGNGKDVTSSNNPKNNMYKKLGATVTRMGNTNSSSITSGSRPEQFTAVQQHAEDDAQDNSNERLFDDVPIGVTFNYNTDNYIEHISERQDGGVAKSTGYSTYHNVEFTYGTKKTNTTVCISGEYARTKEDGDNQDSAVNTDYMSDLSVNDDIPTNDGDTTRSTSGPDGSDGGDSGDDSHTPPQISPTIENKANFDASLSHNRDVKIDFGKTEQTIRIGGGVDLHTREKDYREWTYRLGAFDPETGLGLTYDSTRTYIKKDDEWEKGISSRFRIDIFNPKKADKVVNKDDNNAGSEDSDDNSETLESETPEIKTKTNVGATLVIDNDKFGVVATDVPYQKFKMDKEGNWKRSLVFVNAGILNLTDNDEDRLRLKLSSEYSYKNVRTNGNYTTFDAKVGFEHTFQKDGNVSLAFGEATFKAKRGRHDFEGSLEHVRTNEMNYTTLGLQYNYTHKNWSLGGGIDYINENTPSTKTNYLKPEVRFAYTFGGK